MGLSIFSSAVDVCFDGKLSSALLHTSSSYDESNVDMTAGIVGDVIDTLVASIQKYRND